VLSPEGEPLTGAEVAILGTSYISLDQGRKFNSQSAREGQVVKADNQGRFQLPPSLPNWVVAVHEQGFAKVHSDDLIKSPKVTLQPWGWIEGTLYFGSRPAPAEEIGLVPVETGPNGLQYNFESSKATTDAIGSFIISNAPPGEARLALFARINENSWMWSHLTPITVKAGEATKFKMGGSGRPVVGKARLSNPARAVIWGRGHNTLSTKWPQPPKPLRTDEEIRAWNRSPEYKSARANHRNYGVRFQTDGSFRIENVPAGSYDLRLDIREPHADQPNRDVYIGGTTKEVIVPEIPGGMSEEPLELGEIEVPVRN